MMTSKNNLHLIYYFLIPNDEKYIFLKDESYISILYHGVKKKILGM